MEPTILSAFVLCASVYVLSRIVSWIVNEKEKEQFMRLEKDRLSKIDKLYGRDETR